MIEQLERLKSSIKDLFLSTESFIKVLLLSKKVSIPKTNNATLWLLANGPSLKQQLPNFSNAGLETAAVNLFANHDSYELIRPKIYFLQAPEFYLDDLLETYIVSRITLFDNLVSKTTWPLQLFLPYKSKKYQKNYEVLLNHKYIELVYFNDTPIEGIQRMNQFFFGRQLGMPRPHNILIPSLMLSIYMGYEKIYLLGVDHSWLPEISVDDQNNALVSQKHFYDNANVSAATMQKLGRRQRHLYEILHKFYLTFKGYFDIKEYAKQNGTTIINCTKGSFIDAFEKADLAAVFPKELTKT